jgi:hypothetical protein
MNIHINTAYLLAVISNQRNQVDTILKYKKKIFNVFFRKEEIVRASLTLFQTICGGGPSISYFLVTV